MAKKVTVIFIVMCFIANLTACATMNGSIETKNKSASEIKDEQEEQGRAFVVEAAVSFAGLALGGAVGTLSSPKETALTGLIFGCILGGTAGYLLGQVIYNNTKSDMKKPDDTKTEEYFEQYRNIQLKD